MKKKIDPNLRTPFENYSQDEKAKMSSRGLTVKVNDPESDENLSYQLKNTEFENVSKVAETLAKSFGIYLEFNRAKTGREKDWMYMIRIGIPGGGPISKKQWQILDDIATKYTSSSSYTGTEEPSLRITTRQNIQLHWVKKKDLVRTIREIAESGFFTLNGCGDNTRNVMGCPLSHNSSIFDANKWAQQVGKYFRLPSSVYIQVFEIDPYYLRDVDERSPQERFKYGDNLLNRKFKIGFSALHFDDNKNQYIPDNCVEVRTNDIGVVPLLQDGTVTKFQLYIGGGQGEVVGKPTFSTLGLPFGIVHKDDLVKALDAIVSIHQEWGDRQNRHWARMKYVLDKMGMEWFRSKFKERCQVSLEAPDENLDYGDRSLHHGWTKENGSDEPTWSYGMFIENGRIIDGGKNGKLKSLVRHMMDTYDGIMMHTTPNQDVIFSNIAQSYKERFETDLEKFGYGERNGEPYSKLRRLSGSCVGRDTCKLTYTDSEKFEPYLIDELETKWGDLSESVGVTGCEKQCFRPATKTIGWVGSGFNMYSLKVGGTEDGRHQGYLLTDPDTDDVYLRMVPRKEVATVTDQLIEFYMSHREQKETQAGGMGYFLRRVGNQKIIEWLKQNSKTSHLMKPARMPA